MKNEHDVRYDLDSLLVLSVMTRGEKSLLIREFDTKLIERISNAGTVMGSNTLNMHIQHTHSHSETRLLKNKSWVKSLYAANRRAAKQRKDVTAKRRNGEKAKYASQNKMTKMI